MIASQLLSYLHIDAKSELVNIRLDVDMLGDIHGEEAYLSFGGNFIRFKTVEEMRQVSDLLGQVMAEIDARIYGKEKELE